MLTKDPAPESRSDDEDGDDNGEISEKTAGPSYKEEEDVEEESSDDEEDSMTERRAKRPVDDEEEDNTLSLAQMEETLKPQALEKFANITAIYKKFSKMEAARLDAKAAANELDRKSTRLNSSH